MPALLLGGVGEEGADAGQLARCGRCAEPLSPPVGKEGAKVRCCEVEQPRRQDFLPAISPEKVDQAMRSRDIGAHRVLRAAAVMLKIGGPLRSERSGRVSQCCGCVSHLRIITASVRPRNISNSEP